MQSDPIEKLLEGSDMVIFVGGARSCRNPTTLTFGKRYRVVEHSTRQFHELGGKPWIKVVNDQGILFPYSAKNFQPDRIAEGKGGGDGE